MKVLKWQENGTIWSINALRIHIGGAKKVTFWGFHYVSARNQWDGQACVSSPASPVDPVARGWWITTIPFGKSKFQISSFQTHNMFGHSILTMLQCFKYSKHLMKFCNITRNSLFLFATHPTNYSLCLECLWMGPFLGRGVAVQVQENVKTLGKFSTGSSWGDVFSAYGSVREKVHGRFQSSTVTLQPRAF